MMSMPNCRVPISNAVGGALSARLTAICPKAVALPVRPINTRAEPLTTELPMKIASAASSDQAPGSAMASSANAFFAAVFSTG
jgi:hypothetical protein